mgnify:CR=1 FL=1
MVLKVKAMKTMNRMFWAIAAAVVAVACAKEAEPSHVQESDGLVPMTFSASAEGEIQTKTTYSGRKVYWEAEDEISVFSIGTQVVKTGFKATSVSEDGTLASFSGVAAPGAENYVAVYPHQEANAFDLATQTLTVNIPTDQVGVGNGFASGANVSVALSIAAGTAAEGEEEPAQEESLKFRNVGAMFCFKFETADDAAATKSVTFKAKKSEIYLLENENPYVQKGRPKHSGREMKVAAMNPEVDLRGMDSVEAICVMDRYLDEAMRSNLKQVRIIHGKGTGVLRKAVHESLKRNKYVKKYRLGVYGEGEDGVTIAEFE